MKSIVIAEDDTATRTLLVEALSAFEGCVVTAVEGGTQALATLETIEPDLVLLDVNMPGLDGFEVYQALREREGWGEIPVLFLSAETRDRAKNIDGPFRWIAKPFQLDELLAVVAALLGVEPPV